MPASRAGTPDGSRRKLIAFDAEVWHALHLLSRDSMKSLQELADDRLATRLHDDDEGHYRRDPCEPEWLLRQRA